MTPPRDYLAGSRVAGGVRAVAGGLREAGRGFVQRLLQNPALINLRAAWKRTPGPVLGVGMVVFAVTNLATLQLLGKQLPKQGILLRAGLAVLGIACIARQGVSGKGGGSG